MNNEDFKTYAHVDGNGRPDREKRLCMRDRKEIDTRFSILKKDTGDGFYKT